MNQEEMEKKALKAYPVTYAHDDFRRQPPDRNVRLRHAYIRGCQDTMKDVLERLDFLLSTEGEVSCDPRDKTQNGVLIGIREAIDMLRANDAAGA